MTSYVRDIFEAAGASHHAQVLEAILRQHPQLRWTLLRIVGLETGDLAFEDLRRRVAIAELDRQGAAEIEHPSIEVEKTDVAIGRAPVAEARLAAIETGGGLLHQQGKQAVF